MLRPERLGRASETPRLPENWCRVMGAYPMDSYNIDRFIKAQSSVYDQVSTELRSGLKLTHWMWSIFPQMNGLGSSAMTIKYSISSLEEETEYLNHPILGPRLLECSQLVTGNTDRPLKRILGQQIA